MHPLKLFMLQRLKDTSMQSMGSMEMDPPINVNTPLGQIIIPKLFAQ
jgi:hypothetical protein